MLVVIRRITDRLIGVPPPPLQSSNVIHQELLSLKKCHRALVSLCCCYKMGPTRFIFFFFIISFLLKIPLSQNVKRYCTAPTFSTVEKDKLNNNGVAKIKNASSRSESHLTFIVGCWEDPFQDGCCGSHKNQVRIHNGWTSDPWYSQYRVRHHVTHSSPSSFCRRSQELTFSLSLKVKITKCLNNGQRRN